MNSVMRWRPPIEMATAAADIMRFEMYSRRTSQIVFKKIDLARRRLKLFPFISDETVALSASKTTNPSRVGHKSQHLYLRIASLHI